MNKYLTVRKQEAEAKESKKSGKEPEVSTEVDRLNSRAKTEIACLNLYQNRVEMRKKGMFHMYMSR